MDRVEGVAFGQKRPWIPSNLCLRCPGTSIYPYDPHIHDDDKGRLYTTKSRMDEDVREYWRQRYDQLEDTATATSQQPNGAGASVTRPTWLGKNVHAQPPSADVYPKYSIRHRTFTASRAVTHEEQLARSVSRSSGVYCGSPSPPFLRRGILTGSFDPAQEGENSENRNTIQRTSTAEQSASLLTSTAALHQQQQVAEDRPLSAVSSLAASQSRRSVSAPRDESASRNRIYGRFGNANQTPAAAGSEIKKFTLGTSIHFGTFDCFRQGPQNDERVL